MRENSPPSLKGESDDSCRSCYVAGPTVLDYKKDPKSGGIICPAQLDAKMLKHIPTRIEFEQMAARGRLHKDDNTVIPTDSDLDKAQSPVDLGRLYGYSEDDIAHFYRVRRRELETAYTEYVQDLQQAMVSPAEDFSIEHKR